MSLRYILYFATGDTGPGLGLIILTFPAQNLNL